MPAAPPRRQRVGLVLRLTPLVLVPAMLLASEFPGQFGVSLAYWVLSGGAALAFAAGWRWPVVASFTLSVLAVPLFAAEAWGLSGLIPYLGALALADVAARSERDRTIVATAVCWSVALLLGNGLDRHAAVWTVANAVTVLAAVGLPVLLGLYLRGQKRLAATYRERAADAESRRLAAESAVRAEERTTMARELHDLVAHHMASIVLRVGVAEHVLHDVDPCVTAVFDDVHGTAASALADIRRLQEALRDPASTEVAMIEPEAVWAEIDAAVTRTRAAGLTVATSVDRDGTGVDGVGLDAMARLTLLRVTQEALTNAMKHADRARPVELAITTRDGGVAIRVTSGLAPSDLRRLSSGERNSDAANPAVHGHGLIGMTERLGLIGGHLTAGQRHGEWIVEAWLPATAAPVGSTS